MQIGRRDEKVEGHTTIGPKCANATSEATSAGSDDASAIPAALVCRGNTTMLCFVVRDHNGQQLAYVYFEDEPGGFNTTARSQKRFATVAWSSFRSKAAGRQPKGRRRFVSPAQSPPSMAVQ